MEAPGARRIGIVGERRERIMERNERKHFEERETRGEGHPPTVLFTLKHHDHLFPELAERFYLLARSLRSLRRESSREVGYKRERYGEMKSERVVCGQVMVGGRVAVWSSAGHDYISRGSIRKRSGSIRQQEDNKRDVFPINQEDRTRVAQHRLYKIGRGFNDPTKHIVINSGGGWLMSLLELHSFCLEAVASLKSYGFWLAPSFGVAVVFRTSEDAIRTSQWDDLDVKTSSQEKEKTVSPGIDPGRKKEQQL
ncbi:hypothetical protein Tco_1440063 [Tanacetum coccineum]